MSSRFLYRSQIQFFDFFSSPGGPAQELQAGFDAWIVRKTLDEDAPAQLLPAVFLHEIDKDHFKRHTMQGILQLFVCHSIMVLAPARSIARQ